MDELIRLGYERIDYLGGPQGTYINRVRYNGYTKALGSWGRNFDGGLTSFEGDSVETGRRMMLGILAADSGFDAVLCVNNLVFLGAMSVLQEVQDFSDRQIMMAAFDIEQYLSLLKRPILRANQNVRRMADTAVDLLLDRIDRRASKRIEYSSRLL